MSARKYYPRKAVEAPVRKYVSGRGAYKAKSAPRKAVIRGKGDYSKDYGKRLGSVVGEGLQELLTQLGGLGTAVKVAGMGSYAPIPFSVQSNKLAEGNDPPEIANGRDGSFVVRHREYIKDIYSAAGGVFSIDTFNINPGNRKAFPWLGEIAKNFEQYRIEGMIFEFRTNYSEGTTGPMGSVILATEYDVNKPNFISKVQMENHQYAASCKPSLSMLHPVECARSQTPLTELYVRLSPDGINYDTDIDIRSSDLGRFQIATIGISTGAALNLGELWCTYQIRFLKPRLSINEASLGDYFQNSVGITTLTPFGAAANRTKGRGNTIGLTTTDSGIVTFPSALSGTVYLVAASWIWNVPGAESQPAITPISGCIVNPADDCFGANFQAPFPGEICTRKARTWAITVTSAVPVSFSIGVGAQAGFTFFQMIVAQLPNDLAAQTPASMQDFVEYHLTNSPHLLIEDYTKETDPEAKSTTVNKDDATLSGVYSRQELIKILSELVKKGTTVSSS